MRILFVFTLCVAFFGCEEKGEFEAVDPVVAPKEGPAQNVEKPNGPKTKKPVSPAGTVRFSSPAEYGSKGPLRWTAPKNWVGTKPGSSMRLAEYTVPGPEGKEPSTISIFYFGRGQGGDVEMNINRWIGQFSTKSGDPARDTAEREKTTIDGMTVHLVDVSGTYNPGMAGGNRPPKPEQRMIGAIVDTDAGRFFFKLVGPKTGVDVESENFAKFVESFKKG